MPNRRLIPLSLVLLVSVACGGLQPLTTEEAQARLNIASTKVLDRNGDLVVNLHGEIDRDIVSIDEIPKHVQDAVVAIEDERFWEHGGLDLKSIIRAAVSNVGDGGGGGLQGGSTLSQQLTKNLYFAVPERTLARKVAEAKLTLELESAYSKPQILEMYLNTIYLGRSAYGIAAASRSYFRKQPSKLTLAEGAFLAGIVHEPAKYDFEEADDKGRRETRQAAGTQRRNTVLNKMVELGFITADEAADAKAVDLELEPSQPNRWKHPYYVDMVLRELGVLGVRTPEDLDPRFDFLGETGAERAKTVYAGGLTIETAIDPDMQQAAEDAIDDQLPELDKMWAAMVSLEPETGFVRAIVGGRNYYPDGCAVDEPAFGCGLGKVNLALGRRGGGVGRQPGSSFKPIALATAAQRGISLGTYYDGAPFETTYSGGIKWKVSNYEGSSGPINMVEATRKSVNAAYAHLLIDGIGEGDPIDGAHRVAEMARELGIDFPTPDEMKEACGDNYNVTGGCTPADGVPSIVLGAKEASVMEMAGAYATFANEGVWVKPTSILRIKDGKGNVLYEAKDHNVSRKVLSPGVARAVTKALTGVISSGTGTGASIGRPAAGKTGTAQQWRDAWFIGYVPQLATAVWVGNPKKQEEMLPKNGYPKKVTGGSYPASIWRDYMRAATKGMKVENFKSPPSELFVAVDVPTSYGLPSVVGMDAASAQARLEAAGYSVSVTGCLDLDAPSGVVVKQSPGGGSILEPGSAVEICVNRGGIFDDRDKDFKFGDPPKPASVPDVIGESTAGASSKLRRAGFDVSTVRECPPGGGDPGRVWSQSPPAGTQANTGTTVVIRTGGAGCE